MILAVKNVGCFTRYLVGILSILYHVTVFCVWYVIFGENFDINEVGTKNRTAWRLCKTQTKGSMFDWASSDVSYPFFNNGSRSASGYNANLESDEPMH